MRAQRTLTVVHGINETKGDNIANRDNNNQDANTFVYDTADKASRRRHPSAHRITDAGRYAHLDERRCCSLKLSNHIGSAP